MVLNSFAELARIYGSKATSKKMALSPFVTIESDLGPKAAILWSLVQDREAGKRYGDKGAIIVTPEMLVEESGFSPEKVTSTLLTLVRHNYLRPTIDGTAVKAV